MSKKAFISIFATLFAVTGLTIATTQSSLAQDHELISFRCEPNFIHPVTKARTPATIARGPIGEIPVLYWTSSLDRITPEERCYMVSYRFDRLQKAGSLKYITHGYKNGQPIICTANYPGGNCVEQLFTLRHQDNPQKVLQELLGVRNFSTSALRMAGAIQRINNNWYIDISLFIDYRIGELQKENLLNPSE
ncbi:MAG: hypothetical protein F6K14_28405 [Symploca sp. SIO2C1]|nr:hypothetical protein [Symploca sp. SIO2C1]